MFQTTAIYPNRLIDKRDLEWRFKALQEEGNTNTEFFVKDVLEPICRGYNRVVYGDHGPYIEMEKENILFPLKGKFNDELPEKLPLESEAKFYYYWCYPRIIKRVPPVKIGNFTKKEVLFDAPLPVKVYWQIKPVTDLPNAPKREDGKPSRFKRIEGYADYKRGMYYINPYDFIRIK